ncbi:MAG: DUF2461 domain-containing protein, partial [Myxococcota bacterium]|nr:DUF2461 domain-containing protein [Myxococcota bacterium]
TRFHGFPKAVLDFFNALSEHNNREWFEAHRGEYEAHVLEPARALVSDLGQRLRPLAKDLHADPLVDRSIFRLHRDTRFSKDKRPYKSNLAVFLWEGDGPKLECPGFYMHLEPQMLLIGGGIYIFPPHLLTAFRDCAADAKRGKALKRLVAQLETAFPGGMQSETSKKVPRGFSADHPQERLLRFKGLTVGERGPVPDVVHRAELIDYLMERYQKMVPLHRFLLGLVRQALGK